MKLHRAGCAKAAIRAGVPHITVVAPSNNDHYIKRLVQPRSDPRQVPFDVPYPGVGQMAAANRPGHGSQGFPRMSDGLSTPLREDYFTGNFGGTSGAAPVVTGAVALMLSANKNLNARQVRRILQVTADRDLDPRLDCANDPNVQNFKGDFIGTVSPFFGSGQINIARAVERAAALAGVSAQEAKTSTQGDAEEVA